MKRAATPCAVLLLLALPAAAQSPDALPGDDRPAAPLVALVTIAPGHQDPSAWYGHSAIAVAADDGLQFYTYRLQWSSESRAAVSSALGGSTFSLHRVPAETAMADYAEQGRAVRLLPLPLDADEAASLVTALETERALTRARPVAYEPIDDNCATRIRGFVDQALDGAMHEATLGVPAGTPRDSFRPYVEHDARTWLALDLLLGPGADRPIDAWQAMFMPLRLEAETAALLADQGLRPVTVMPATLPNDPPVRIAGAVAAATVLLVAFGAATGWAAATRRAPRWIVALPPLAASSILLVPAGLVTASWLGDLGPYWTGNRAILVLSPIVVVTPLVAAWAIGSHRGRRLLHAALTAQAVLAAVAVLLVALPNATIDPALVAAVVPVQIASWLGARFGDPPAVAFAAEPDAAVTSRA